MTDTNTATDTGAKLRMVMASQRPRITVTELALGVGKSRPYMQRVVLGRDQATDALKAAVIAFLAERTGLNITHEQVF